MGIVLAFQFIPYANLDIMLFPLRFRSARIQECLFVLLCPFYGRCRVCVALRLDFLVDLIRQIFRLAANHLNSRDLHRDSGIIRVRLPRFCGKQPYDSSNHRNPPYFFGKCWAGINPDGDHYRQCGSSSQTTAGDHSAPPSPFFPVPAIHCRLVLYTIFFFSPRSGLRNG